MSVLASMPLQQPHPPGHLANMAAAQHNQRSTVCFGIGIDALGHPCSLSRTRLGVSWLRPHPCSARGETARKRSNHSCCTCRAGGRLDCCDRELLLQHLVACQVQHLQRGSGKRS